MPRRSADTNAASPSPGAGPGPIPAPVSAAGGATPRRASVAPFAALAGATAAGMIALASVGGPHSPAEAALALVGTAVGPGAAALAYGLAGVGLGRVARPVFRRSADPWAVQMVVGMSILVSVSHGLGCLGLLGGVAGRAIAVGVLAIGLGLLGQQVVGAGPRSRVRVGAPSILWAAPIALVLVAASNPPGWLWGTEFGGFDALSYHLQLPQEWLARGRVEPLGHNVYSYLPGYLETAYLHLAVALGSSPLPKGGAAVAGLLGGGGGPAIAAQHLHAVVAIGAGVAVARTVSMAALAIGRPAGAAPWVAGALVLGTPWTIVCGSLAYNELGVVLFCAGAMLVAMDGRLAPACRGALCGWLVGAACGCKPTALFFAGPPAGLLLIGLAPRREWAALAAAGAAAGVAALAPWLVRNALASGNPVFPFATSVFGVGHWTADQVSRYAAGHAFDGSIGDRLRLLFLPDAAGEQRGLAHEQWALFGPVVVAAVVSVLVVALAGGRGAVGVARGRRLAALVAAGLAAQVAGWMLATHLQSRFLTPLLATGGLAIGVAMVRFGGAGWRGRAAILAGSAVVLVQTAASISIFAVQQGGRPNAALAAGPAAFSGELYRSALAAAPPEERAAFIAGLPPTAFLNLAVPADRVVYLLGDSTPFYVRPPVVYHTTWDSSPLGDAVRAAPGDPAAWTRALSGRGGSLVLFNAAEVDRLTRDGWYDPLVTPGLAEAWLEEHATLVRRFGPPFDHVALYELAPAAPGRAP